MNAPISEGLSVAGALADIDGELHTLQARINSLAGAASAFGAALDNPGPGSGEEAQVAYTAAFIFETLHRELGEIIQDVGDVRRRMADAEPIAFENLFDDWRGAREEGAVAEAQDQPDDVFDPLIRRVNATADAVMRAPAGTVLEAAQKLQVVLAAQDIEIDPAEAYTAPLEWPNEWNERMVRCVVTAWADLLRIAGGAA